MTNKQYYFSFAGSALAPATMRDILDFARHTGMAIMDLVEKGITPAQILTKEAFENAIIVHSAIGGSTNATLHLPAIAKEIGITFWGGMIAFLEDGDLIEYDVEARKINVVGCRGERLSTEKIDAILQERSKKGIVPRPARTGLFKRYTQYAASAMEGVSY